MRLQSHGLNPDVTTRALLLNHYAVAPYCKYKELLILSDENIWIKNTLSSDFACVNNPFM